MEPRTIRQSNLELLRILCIIFIIGDHFVGQSGVIETSNLVLSFFIVQLQVYLGWHVVFLL